MKKKIDYILLISTVVLCLFGLIMIYSSSCIFSCFCVCFKFNKKTGIFSILLYIPVIFTLFYVVLGIAKVLPWHPGWLLILFGILVDFAVVAVRLISGTKVKEEEDTWSED